MAEYSSRRKSNKGQATPIDLGREEGREKNQGEGRNPVEGSKECSKDRLAAERKLPPGISRLEETTQKKERTWARKGKTQRMDDARNPSSSTKRKKQKDSKPLPFPGPDTRAQTNGGERGTEGGGKSMIRGKRSGQIEQWPRKKQTASGIPAHPGAPQKGRQKWARRMDHGSDHTSSSCRKRHCILKCWTEVGAACGRSRSEPCVTRSEIKKDPLSGGERS